MNDALCAAFENYLACVRTAFAQPSPSPTVPNLRILPKRKRLIADTAEKIESAPEFSKLVDETDYAFSCANRIRWGAEAICSIFGLRRPS